MLDLDMRRIKEILVFETAVDRIREGCIASADGNVQTGEVVHIAFSQAHGDCRVKSGHIDGTESDVVKIASGFYDNPIRGLPSSNGMMLAFSAQTGETLAILRDEGRPTDMRTAIGGVLAIQALEKSDATRVLIIGTGVQARLQVKCLARLMPGRALVYRVRDRDAAATQVLATELNTLGVAVDAAHRPRCGYRSGRCHRYDHDSHGTSVSGWPHVQRPPCHRNRGGLSGETGIADRSDPVRGHACLQHGPPIPPSRGVSDG